MALRDEINSDLQVIEADLGNPTFVWQGNSYAIIPSITEFDRQLDTGGYVVAKMLTGTVRKFNSDGSAIFTTYPTAQDKVVYSLDGLTYRIEMIKHDPTNSYFNIKAVNANRGI